MLNLMPLELCVRMEATRAACRLHVGGQLQACSFGHGRIWGRATDQCPLLLMPGDHQISKLVPSNLFKVIVPDREEWGADYGPEFFRNSDVWYTDGSLVAGGAGAGIFASSRRLSQSIALGSYTTVFQAEVFAILVCGLVLLSDPKRGGKPGHLLRQ